MRTLIACCIIVLSVSLPSNAQKVTDIRFQGLKRTHSSYLEQFIEIKQGDILDSAKLISDVIQLVNLEIINKVQFNVEIKGDSSLIVFVCEESGTFLPIINFGGIADNFWFGIGASEINLWGKGHKLVAFYQYNNRHSFFIDYTISRVFRSNWDINVMFVNWSTIEPLYFAEGTLLYKYDNDTYGGVATYNINRHHKAALGGSYFTEFYRKDSQKVLFGPDNVRKNKWLAKLIYEVDYKNYNYFLIDGWSNSFHLETVATINEDIPFHLFYNDFKYFNRIGLRSNIGVKVRLGLSTNNDTPFAPFVLDSYLNIRGSGNKINRGTGSAVLNLEYRYTMMDKSNVAFQAVVFTDVGGWRLPGGDFNDFVNPEVGKMFSGIGVRGIYKKIHNAILRIDYGVNVNDSSERGFVVGVGQYF